MRLNELARAAEVPATSVKHYLRIGLLPAGERVNATTSRYSASHVHRLELIRDLRRVVGLPLEAIGRIVQALTEEPVHRALGVVQTEVLAHAGAPAADAGARGRAAASSSGAGGADEAGGPVLRAHDVGAAMGWTAATPQAWVQLDEHLEAMRSWGLPVTADSVEVLARAAEQVAAAQLGALARTAAGPLAPEAGADVDQLARWTALGVHAQSTLLLRLLAVAQGHHAQGAGGAG